MKQSTKTSLAHALSTARGVPIFDGLEAARGFIACVRRLDFSTSSDAELDRHAASIRAEVQRVIATDNSGQKSPAPKPHRDLCDPWLAKMFALTAEFCARELSLAPFDEQLAAGLAMENGHLAQMQTGEGKTLAAVFPAVAAALRGEPVLLLTANDYLARRDAAWMGPVYRRWGLEVAAIQENQTPDERRTAYAADLVYLTAREAGFDYLRDQLAYAADELVQPPFGLAIVDEADLLLIDEARIPLVIAGADDSDGTNLAHIARAAAELAPGLDFRLDPAGRRLSLTLRGEQRAASLLGLEGLHHAADRPAFARLHAALHARHLLRRDVDYLVRSDRVEQVDVFTGRVADRRQWPWGVQAAVETQEGVSIQPEGRVFGRITLQHFIGLFPRLAAMTATAEPAAVELQECYGLAVAVIPPRLPVLRVDAPDQVFRTRADKLAAVRAKIAAAHLRGQPVLVGTASVAESEELSADLARHGIPCQVLNARQDEQEAFLVAQAGRRGMVTISTNMAGRGTDIRLGDPGVPGSAFEVAALGGLLVVGTERHESRRIDDQLRGRSGRQGEPGRSQYFVSLEDSFFVRYGVRDFLPPWPESDAAIDDPRFLAEIDRASRLIESQNAQLRRSLRRYAALVEMDRRYLRQLRDEALLENKLPLELLRACGWGPDQPDNAPAVGSRSVGRAPAGVDTPSTPRHPPLLVRLWLHGLDNFWADHLAWIEDLREGIHLVQYGGRDPALEYNRLLAERFETGLAETIAACADTWRSLPPQANGASLDSIGMRRPSTTWTYLVNENVLPDFTLAMIAGANAGVSALAAVPLFLIEQVGKLFRRLAGKPPVE